MESGHTGSHRKKTPGAMAAITSHPNVETAKHIALQQHQPATQRSNDRQGGGRVPGFHVDERRPSAAAPRPERGGTILHRQRALSESVQHFGGGAGERAAQAQSAASSSIASTCATTTAAPPFTHRSRPHHSWSCTWQDRRQMHHRRGRRRAMVSGNSDGGASWEARSSSARCLTARGLARCTQHPTEE